MYVKAEYFNPASSVKDRLALVLLMKLKNKDILKPGQTVVEATSGNTGIGLAFVCAAKKLSMCNYDARKRINRKKKNDAISWS